MANDERPRYAPTGEQAASGVLAGQAEWVKKAGKPMLLHNAGTAARIVANRIPGLPGLVFDAASYATAKDKDRARAELAGQVLGGLVGAVGGPVGVAVGSMAGEKLGELAYDHRDDIQAWMDARWNDVSRAAGEQVLPYTPIPRINRAINRR